jgi:biopolymer transport protein ExbD
MARRESSEQGIRPSVAMHRRTTKRRSTYYCWMDVSALLAVFLVIFISLAVSPSGNRGSHGAGVDLLKSAHSRLLPRAIREDALRVAVTRDGQLYFGNRRVSPEELPKQIRNGIRGGAENRAYISADARVKYGDVKIVLDQIRSAGVENVSFLTLPAPLRQPGSDSISPELSPPKGLTSWSKPLRLPQPRKFTLAFPHTPDVL